MLQHTGSTVMCLDSLMYDHDVSVAWLSSGHTVFNGSISITFIVFVLRGLAGPVNWSS